MLIRPVVLQKSNMLISKGQPICAISRPLWSGFVGFLSIKEFCMIVVMQSKCSEADIEHVLNYLDRHGLAGHLSQGVERTVIGVLGAPGPSGTPTSIGT